MKNLTKFALMRPVTMLLALVTVLYFGLQGVLGSPMELTPDINFPMMIIYCTFPGAGPEDIVETINKPLENTVATLSGIKTYYSYGMENVSLMSTAPTWTAPIWTCGSRWTSRKTAFRTMPAIPPSWRWT